MPVFSSARRTWSLGPRGCPSQRRWRDPGPAPSSRIPSTDSRVPVLWLDLEPAVPQTHPRRRSFPTASNGFFDRPAPTCTPTRLDGGRVRLNLGCGDSGDKKVAPPAGAGRRSDLENPDNLALAGAGWRLISLRSVVECHTAPYGAEFGGKAPSGAFHASPPRPIYR
jgi:hypothetical protein